MFFFHLLEGPQWLSRFFVFLKPFQSSSRSYLLSVPIVLNCISLHFKFVFVVHFIPLDRLSFLKKKNFFFYLFYPFTYLCHLPHSTTTGTISSVSMRSDFWFLVVVLLNSWFKRDHAVFVFVWHISLGIMPSRSIILSQMARFQSFFITG